MAVLLILGLADSQTKVLSASITKPKAPLAGADWSKLDPGGVTKPVAAKATAKVQTTPKPAKASTLPPYGGPATAGATTAAPTVPVGRSIQATSAIALGKQMSDAKFGPQHWPALYNLWMRESGWRPNARNPRSGACGIPQALPCRKIPDMSTEGQIRWGLDYIGGRYGNPTNAWRFWQSRNWY